MMKKTLIVGMAATVSTLASAEDALEPSAKTMQALDQFGRAEKVVCTRLLEFDDIEELTAQEVVDRQILESIMNRISDSPLEYCADRLMNKIDKHNSLLR